MKYYKCRKEDIGKSVLEILISEGELLPETPCGGKGNCGKCRMKLKGNICPASDSEKALLKEEQKDGIRLICMARAEGDFEYEEIKNESSAKIQTDYYCKETEIKNRNSLLAIDIGTTTVAMYKIENGSIYEKTSFLNPQRIHGADVISRLVYASQGGEDSLKNEICNAITKNCEKEFDHAVICGNTAMEHFLCGKDSSGIAKLPFIPATLFGENYSFDFCKNTFIAPCIAAYVGGDITLGMLAAELDKEKEITLYIDIGTNGEIALKKGEKILCCAAAAGPAFEGGNIEFGMTATKGAVERVYAENNTYRYNTVGDSEPEGICGSGLIDAAAVFLELELMDETGRLCEDKYYFGEKVFISQKDIRNLQSAKAAIAAGIRTLCYEMNCKVSDIEKVIIAGGFGTHINTDSALQIGLIPYEFKGKTESLGNLAGLGAVLLCLNNDKERLNTLLKNVEYTELSGNKKFNEYYIEEMMFEY
ncbi:MAG: DUF4445 domain-containing protein [Clostridia bacterium]|nr:DUF4445 domain-containing protein [Clostridia bacterium]